MDAFLLGELSGGVAVDARSGDDALTMVGFSGVPDLDRETARRGVPGFELEVA